MLRPWSPSLYITGQAMQETHFPEPPSLCTSEWESAGGKAVTEVWVTIISITLMRQAQDRQTHPHRYEVHRGQNGLENHAWLWAEGLWQRGSETQHLQKAAPKAADWGWPLALPQESSVPAAQTHLWTYCALVLRLSTPDHQGVMLLLSRPLTPDSATPRTPQESMSTPGSLSLTSKSLLESQPLSRWCYPRAVEASNSCIKILHTWSAKHGFFPNWSKTIIKLQISSALLKHWREASMYFNKLAIFIFSFNPSPFSLQMWKLRLTKN